MTATFSSVTEAAKFCAELVRQGVTFELHEAANGSLYRVTFTGGF